MGSSKFCDECHNLLYPVEDKNATQPDEKRLLLACRNCDYEEPSDTNRVYRHVIIHPPSEQTMVLTDLAADPTLPRTNKICTQCEHNEAVFFQSASKRADTKMTLFYVCSNRGCGYRWTD